MGAGEAHPIRILELSGVAGSTVGVVAGGVEALVGERGRRDSVDEAGGGAFAAGAAKGGVLSWIRLGGIHTAW